MVQIHLYEKLSQNTLYRYKFIQSKIKNYEHLFFQYLGLIYNTQGVEEFTELFIHQSIFKNITLLNFKVENKSISEGYNNIGINHLNMVESIYNEINRYENDVALGIYTSDGFFYFFKDDVGKKSLGYSLNPFRLSSHNYQYEIDNLQIYVYDVKNQQMYTRFKKYSNIINIYLKNLIPAYKLFNMTLNEYFLKIKSNFNNYVDLSDQIINHDFNITNDSYEYFKLRNFNDIAFQLKYPSKINSEVEHLTNTISDNNNESKSSVTKSCSFQITENNKLFEYNIVDIDTTNYPDIVKTRDNDYLCDLNQNIINRFEIAYNVNIINNNNYIKERNLSEYINNSSYIRNSVLGLVKKFNFMVGIRYYQDISYIFQDKNTNNISISDKHSDITTYLNYKNVFIHDLNVLFIKDIDILKLITNDKILESLKKFFLDNGIGTYFTNSISPDYVRKFIDIFYHSISKRIKHNEDHIAVYFSGGVDSTLIALFLHLILPKNGVIYLINTTLPDSHDRKMGIQSFNELCKVFSQRKFVFVKNDLDYITIMREKDNINALIAPLKKYIDFNIAAIYYFSSLAVKKYSHVVFIGSGADELFCGYNKYKKHIYGIYSSESYLKTIKSHMFSDLFTISVNNLSRDYRVISSFGIDPKIPFLDNELIKFSHYISNLDYFIIQNNDSYINKCLLRLVLIHFGLREAAKIQKKAMQYGTGIIKYEKKIFN